MPSISRLGLPYGNPVITRSSVKRAMFSCLKTVPCSEADNLVDTTARQQFVNLNWTIILFSHHITMYKPYVNDFEGKLNVYIRFVIVIFQ